ARPRSGFSLIEVMVAMTLLSIVLLNLAQVTTALSLRGRNNDLYAKRTASLQLESNKFGAVPFADIASWPTADQTVTRGNFTYTRKLTITTQSSARYTIKIVVVPALDATKKDSIIIDRTLPPSGSPLCTGC
ncbi:MAG: type IV pilus modification PilV family protein, partial [Gemmatimonadaceae bacterium]